jgi:hypothetical protein
MPLASPRPVVTDWPPIDPADPSTVVEERDAVVAAVREHAGELAYALARLEGGDYGTTDFATEGGTWTVSYEGGDLEYLRFAPTLGSEVYVVSTKRDPDAEALATALENYPAFVAAFNEHVRAREGVLDDVDTDFPDVASTDTVVAERDRVLDRIRAVCDRIAAEHRRYEGGDYGTYEARVDGTRWECKYDTDGTSYLRVGGESGVYLLSQYEHPSAADIKEYAPQFSDFVDAYNEDVAALEAELEAVEL